MSYVKKATSFSGVSKLLLNFKSSIDFQGVTEAY